MGLSFYRNATFTATKRWGTRGKADERGAEVDVCRRVLEYVEEIVNPYFLFVRLLDRWADECGAEVDVCIKVLEYVEEIVDP